MADTAFGMRFESFKKNFFDVKKILAGAASASTKVLNQFGAMVRKAAIYSIKSRDKGVSEPGSPPLSHQGARNRAIQRDRKSRGLAPAKNLFRGIKEIFYAREGTENVVIGPTGTAGRPTIPEVLEYGGERQFVSDGKLVTGHYRARPFMRPALAATLPKLPGLWANSVK